ncbi:MAG TPA: helix-turn-helix transcriptional regulator [Acidimicrobiales bacterium]
MRPAELVRFIRRETGLSLRALAQAAGVATSTVHRIERGDLNPTVDVIERIAQAAGMVLHVEPQVDHATSLVGLAMSIRRDIEADPDDRESPVRRAAELVGRFWRADASDRTRMLAAPPQPTGDRRWDAFVGGLAEWLAVRAGLHVPAWAHADDRYLHHGWWVTTMPSMRAWEYAGTPASFKIRGVYLHRESLVNV